MNLFDKIRDYISQHPKVVARLFARHNIQAEPSHRNVGNAIAVLKEPFTNDLLDLITPDHNNYSSAVGDPNFQAIADGLARIGLGASNLARDVKGVPRLQSARNPMIDPRGYPYGSNIDRRNDDAYNQTDRIFGINKTLFLALAAILVIAVFMQFKGK